MSAKTASADPLSIFQQLKEKSLHDDLRIFVAIAIAGSLVFTLASLLMTPDSGSGFGDSGLYFVGFVVFVGLVWSLINGAVALLAISLIEHFFLLFVDEHKGFEKTMKSAIYALVPVLLFFWVTVIVESAFVSLLLLVCFCLITFFGVRIFHEKSLDRAAFVSLATSAVFMMLFFRQIFSQGLLISLF
jgi:hypothetical protein